MTLHPDIWLAKVGDHENRYIPVTQFDNAKCNVCLGIDMIYTGNGEGKGTNTVEASVEEGDEEMKKNRKEWKR